MAGGRTVVGAWEGFAGGALGTGNGRMRSPVKAVIAGPGVPGARKGPAGVGASGGLKKII